MRIDGNVESTIYDTIIDQVDANTKYICEAAVQVPPLASSSPGWRIQKITVTGTVTEVRTKGLDFSLIADSRATYF